MSRFLRLALGAGASLALVSAAAPSHAQGAAEPPAPHRVWAQDGGDLPADPTIRFGVLPNGMRYAIMPNDTPTHQVSLRLRIGSGSLEEDDGERGLAHFLEHMAFDGSTHVPKGEMIRTLERLGLAFGADTNASTGFTETVFQFDLPESDPKTVGTGLMLMREIASNLTIAPAAVDAERGVVLSEERLRDTPDFEAMKGRLGFDFKDQLVAQRLPIGLVGVIKGATAAQLRSFYAANYRPDRATLIVTGDVDPAALEADIRARFADWRPVGPETATPDYGTPIPRGAATELEVRPGVTPSISIDQVAPYDTTPDSAAREQRDLVERIALMALNQRLERIAHSDDAPFLQAYAYRQNFERSDKPATLLLSFRPEGWRRALDAAVAAQRQALAYGFSQAEVDREVTEYRVLLANAAAGAGTRRTPDLANEIARSVDEDDVETAPSEDLKLFDTDVQGLSAATVDQALRHAFVGAGPLLSMATPDPVEGGQAAVASAFAAAEAAPVARPEQAAAKRWTHTDFGQPGRVVERRTVPDLGVTFVRFANGVRLIVKPSAFRKDQVLVAVHFDRGRLDLPKDRDPSTWASAGFLQGGLNDLTYDDIQQVLASRTASIALGLDDSSFALTGATRAPDLGVQLQLIAAYMTTPGWRPEAFSQTRSEVEVALSTLSATPQGVEARDLGQLERSGDDRWAVPTAAEVQGDPIAPFKALLQRALTHGPLEVEIVGDVGVDAAIRETAATFGALAPRPADPTAPGAREVRFPAPTPTPVLRTHTGRADQAIAYIAWPTTDFYTDLQRTREIYLTSEILGSRLIDQVRIAEGATYSPVARAESSETFPGYGFAFASVETPPVRIAGFYGDVARITTDMATKGVTPDELERARLPHIEAIEKSQQTNEYWLARLDDADLSPDRLTVIRDTVPGYRRISADDVRRIAAEYLTDSTAWKFEVEPIAPSPTAGARGGAIAVPPVKTPPGVPAPSTSATPPGPSAPLAPTPAIPAAGRPSGLGTTPSGAAATH